MTGKIKNMDSLSQQADKLIKKYAVGSSLAGFIPVSILDVIVLVYVQRIMLYRLSRLYGIPFKKNLVRVWITTLTSGVASEVGSVLKVFPGVGTLVGGAGMATLGVASTYAVGKVFKKHFEKGGTLEDFDPERSRNALDAAQKKAKELQANPSLSH